MNAHRFGGLWTQEKLRCIERYLDAYTTAMSNRAFFETWYIDAFAGTSYAEDSGPEEGFQAAPTDTLFDVREFDVSDDTTGQELRKGSTRIALELKRAFSRYVFIDRKPEHCEDLTLLKAEYPERADSISIRCADANDALLQIATTTDWRRRRGVLFLDPYGTQVSWTTVEAIARTRAIDVWYLFPFSMGPIRMFPARHSQLAEENRQTLNRLFGTNSWEDAVYPLRDALTLEGSSSQRTKASNVPEVLNRFILERLASVFPAVAPKPRVLRNSRNSPLYLLCFALSNPSPRAVELALKIANYVLEMP